MQISISVTTTFILDSNLPNVQLKKPLHLRSQIDRIQRFQHATPSHEISTLITSKFLPHDARFHPCLLALVDLRSPPIDESSLPKSQR